MDGASIISKYKHITLSLRLFRIPMAFVYSKTNYIFVKYGETGRKQHIGGKRKQGRSIP